MVLNDSKCWRGSNKYSGQLTLRIYSTIWLKRSLSKKICDSVYLCYDWKNLHATLTTASEDTASPLVEVAWQVQVNFPRTSMASSRLTSRVTLVYLIEVEGSIKLFSDFESITSSLQTKKAFKAWATLHSEKQQEMISLQEMAEF